RFGIVAYPVDPAIGGNPASQGVEPEMVPGTAGPAPENLYDGCGLELSTSPADQERKSGPAESLPKTVFGSTGPCVRRGGFATGESFPGYRHSHPAVARSPHRGCGDGSAGRRDWWHYHRHHWTKRWADLSWAHLKQQLEHLPGSGQRR